MNYTTIFVIFFCDVYFCQHENNEDLNKLITNCVSNAIPLILERGSVLTIVRNNAEDTNLIMKLNNLNSLKIYLRKANANNSKINNEAYLLTVSNPNEFIHAINGLRNDIYWNPNSMFFVVLWMEVNITMLNFIFKKFLQVRVLKALVIGIHSHQINIYSYNPYDNNNCGLKFDKIITMCKCDEIKNVTSFFPMIYLKDIHQCTLKVIAHYWHPFVIEHSYKAGGSSIGIEEYAMNLMAELFKVQLVYTYIPIKGPFGKVLQNFTITGPLRNLSDNTADIVFGGYALTANDGTMFRYIWGHYYFSDGVKIVVPRDTGFKKWRIVYLSFRPKVWILVISTIIMYCTIFLVKINSKNFTLLRTVDNCRMLLYLWSYLFQNVSGFVEKTVHRYVLVSWIWFIMLINSFYQTSFTSLISAPNIKSPINDIETLKAFGLKPCVSSTTKLFVNSLNIEIPNEDNIYIKECESVEDSFRVVTTRNDRFFISSLSRLISFKFDNVDDFDKIYILKEDLHKLVYCIYTYKGFPFLEEFQMNSLKINEAGLLRKKFLEVLHQNKRNLSGLANNYIQYIPKISLLALRIPFICLFIGIILALTVFILEITYCNIKT